MATKVSLGILIVLVLLAAGIAVMSFNFVDASANRAAGSRLAISARAAREIHSAQIVRIRSALEVLAGDRTVVDLLNDPTDGSLLADAKGYLDGIRSLQGVDILNLIAPDGTVLLRVQSPSSRGDSLAIDPMVRQVLNTRHASAGAIILDRDRLGFEGGDLIERCLAAGGEPAGMLVGAAVPVLQAGQLIGIVQMGRLLNGSVAEVDHISDAVFENEVYQDKPVGTATILLGDLGIATSALNGLGGRAVGTQVAPEVAERVLDRGVPWTGRAMVADSWYLSQYDPILNPDGEVIGMLQVGELEQRYLDLRNRTIVSSIGVIFTAMLLAFLLFFFIIRGILKPVQALVQATDRLAAGDPAFRVEAKCRDDMGELATSFDAIGARLDNQRREIESNRQELEALTGRLEAVNEEQIDTLAFVSHELKNPLSSAVMSLYTVMDGFLGEVNRAQQKSLASVARTLDYFHEMILTYLESSRLAQDELEINRVEVKIGEQVVAPVVADLEREIGERKLVIESRIPQDLTLAVDAGLIRIVYRNLISNAIRYGRDGGAIVLDARASGAKVILSVWNEGDGIAPEKIPLLFKKFSRLDGDGTMGWQGTGLGLYFCREIIARHGGEIWVDSKMGKGVRFCFALFKPEEAR